MNNAQLSIASYSISNPPLSPFLKGGDEYLKCRPSRGYYTQRHRAPPGAMLS